MGLVLFSLAVLAQSGGSASGPPPPAKCDSAEHRQFDFWVGKWDVYRSDTNQLVAHSLIEKLYAGCALMENWMPIGGTGGGSLNSWRPATKRWHQTWTDSGNNWNEYVGGLEGDAMVISGTSTSASGVSSPVRITYQRGDGGSVVQTGYQSGDGGKSWSLTYQFIYRPASPSK